MKIHRLFFFIFLQAACFQAAVCAASSIGFIDSSSLPAPIPIRANDTILFADTLIPEDTTEEEFDEDSALAAEEDAESLDDKGVNGRDTLGMGALSVSNANGMEVGARNGLYRGISVEQDSLAGELIRKIWSFEWDAVEKIGKKMQKLERKEKLPPLGNLLVLSALVIRLQNGEISGKRSEKHCREEAERTAKTGLDLSDPSQSPDSLLATNLFIYGGIKGTLATLQINRNPIAAGIDGLNAVDKLEKAIGKDARLKDVCLGLGIFYCALAKASVVVRSALNLIGRPVSLEKGLAYLRQSAYGGRYTSVMAKLYLIQFLSPYLGDQANEKSRIFRSLEASFPENPYFLFLRLEENLCFHPEKAFDPSIRRSLRKKIASFGDDDYSIARYANLVKWQYKLIDPFTETNFRPDTAFDLGEFAYYPLFLSALREKYAAPQSEIMSPDIRKHRTALVKKLESKVMKLLVSSSMSQSWRGFYAWHVRDALKMEN